MKRHFLLAITVGLLFLGVGCSAMPPQSNSTSSNRTSAPVSTSFSSSPSSPAGVYSGFSKLTFGKIGGRNPYTITILSPNQKLNTDLENGLITSNSKSACINTKQKLVMEEFEKLDVYFTKMDFWNLPDTIGSQQPNTEEGDLFIEVDSDAGKKKAVLNAGTSNTVFDNMYKAFLSIATKPGCAI
jgi:hypothetical protein